MNTSVMFSSAKDEWATPQEFFDKLDALFHFTLDPCATSENAKCPKYYTKEEMGWRRVGRVRWYFVIHLTARQ